MSPQESTNLVWGIYDRIFDSVTKTDTGGQPLMSPSTTVLSFMKPGKVINSRDFRNPWSPGNSSGSTVAALNVADLVDTAPKLSSIYTDSGLKISQIYGDMLSSVQAMPQDDPEVQRELDKAFAVLYRNVKVVDPETGEETTELRKSADFEAYFRLQAAYMAQRAAYIQAYTAAQESDSGRRNWPMLAPALQIPVRQAYAEWRSRKADQIEQALAIENTLSQNALNKVFDQARALYEGYGVELEAGTGQINLMRSNLLPSDWHSPRSETAWTTVDSASGSYSRSSSSEFTSFGGSASFSLGIFSIGGGGGHASEHRHVSSETSNLRFSFDYALVTCQRMWLNFSLFFLRNWKSSLYTKGQISNGTKNNQENSLLPLLPTAFVVARNVKISANWSRSDYDFLKNSVNGGGQIGIGPFSIGGSYSNSSTNETFTSAFAGDRIIAPSVQIIGTINQVVPYCPPA